MSVDITRPWTRIFVLLGSNCDSPFILHDTRASLAVKGLQLLIRQLAMQDVICSQHLMEASTSGKDAIKANLQVLEDLKYLYRVDIDVNGFTRSIYASFAAPFKIKPERLQKIINSELIKLAGSKQQLKEKLVNFLERKIRLKDDSLGCKTLLKDSASNTKKISNKRKNKRINHEENQAVTNYSGNLEFIKWKGNLDFNFRFYGSRANTDFYGRHFVRKEEKRKIGIARETITTCKMLCCKTTQSVYHKNREKSSFSPNFFLELKQGFTGNILPAKRKNEKILLKNEDKTMPAKRGDLTIHNRNRKNKISPVSLENNEFPAKRRNNDFLLEDQNNEKPARVSRNSARAPEPTELINPNDPSELIFDFWNSQAVLTTHRRGTKLYKVAIDRIKRKIKANGGEMQIRQAILDYAWLLEQPDTRLYKGKPAKVGLDEFFGFNAHTDVVRRSGSKLFADIESWYIECLKGRPYLIRTYHIKHVGKDTNHAMVDRLTHIVLESKAFPYRRLEDLIAENHRDLLRISGIIADFTSRIEVRIRNTLVKPIDMVLEHLKVYLQRMEGRALRIYYMLGNRFWQDFEFYLVDERILRTYDEQESYERELR